MMEYPLMNRRILMGGILLLFSVAVIACGGSDETTANQDNGGAVVGDADRGEMLYKQTAIGSASAPGCVTCHSLEPDQVLVGPPHAGLGTTAETRIPGKSAEQYLRDAIVDPDLEITEGFAPGIMYKNYARELSDQEIADLVAYLLTLK